MVKLFISEQHPEYVAVQTDSKTMHDWLKGSPSRFWKYGLFYYPVEELEDIIEFCNLVKLDITMTTQVQEQYNNFKAKVQLLKYYQEKNALSDEEFTRFSDVPLFSGKLFEYQKPLIVQMLLMKQYLLAVEVGLGKTVLSAYALCLLKKLKPDLRALIICEANQLHKPWLENIYKLTKVKDITVLQGDIDSRRSTIYDPDAKRNWLWLTTYDTVRIEESRMEKKWDVIIMDEITKVKNISTLASKSIRTFDADYMWGLSATPVTNTFYDLYGIMKIMNPRLFTNKENYTNRYLVLDYFGRPKKLNKLTVPELNRKMQPWMIQKTKKELGMQKPIKIDTIAVPLTPSQKILWDGFQDALERGVKTSLDVHTHLRQVCNSSKLFDEYSSIPFSESTNKLEVIKNIIADVVDKQKKNIIVFSYFVPIVHWLKEYFDKDYSVDVLTGQTKKTCKEFEQMDCKKCSYYKKCKSIKKIVYDFNTGKTEILFGTDSMSRSHDLRTCSNMINFDLPWSGSDLVQRIGRMDRATNPAQEFNVYSVITEGTLEEKIVKLIETKEKETGQVFPKYSVSFSKMSSTIRVSTND